MPVPHFIFIIFLGLGVTALDVQAETQRTLNQRNPLLEAFTNPATEITDAVSDLYEKLNELIGMEVEVTEEMGVSDLLFSMLSYRRQALSASISKNCPTVLEMHHQVQAKIRESFQVQKKMGPQDFETLFSKDMLAILTEIQTQLGADLLCQFNREIAKDSNELAFDFYLNVLTEAQSQIFKKLDDVQSRLGMDTVDEKEAAVQVLVNFQDIFVKSKLTPFKQIAQLLKMPISQLKHEIVLLLLKSTEGQHVAELGVRAEILTKAAGKLLLVSKEEASFMQVYVVSASLKSATPSKDFQMVVDQVIANVLAKLYESGRNSKAIELLMNVAERKLGERVQSEEHRQLLTEMVYSTGFPADFDSNPRLAIQNQLQALDMLTYLKTDDIFGSVFETAVSNLALILQVPDEVIDTFNAPKFGLSDSLIKIATHLDYYTHYYQTATDFASRNSLAKRESWAQVLQGFINQRFTEKSLSAENYLIMKIHVALYLQSPKDIPVQFLPFSLEASPFANGKFENFKNIMEHIFAITNPNKPLPQNDLALANYFSGRTFSSNDFAILQIKIDYRESEEVIRMAGEEKVRMIVNIENGALPSLEKKKSNHRLSAFQIQRQDSIHVLTPGYEAFGGSNIVDVMAGVLPPEEFEKLKKMEFMEYVKGKQLIMREGDVEHHYVFVQRIASTDPCKTKLELKR